LSLNDARKFLRLLAKPMAAVLRYNATNIKVLKDYQNELTQISGTLQDLEKRQKKTVERPEVVQIDYPKTVCSKHTTTDKNVTIYTQVCHDHCYITGVPTGLMNRSELQRCKAMKNGTCRRCSHHWSLHMHITYNIVYVLIEEDDEDVLSLLSDKTTEKEAKQRLIAAKNKEIESLNKEREKMLNINAQFASFLKEHAITPYNDDLKSYLELQLKEEIEKGQQGAINKDLIKSLETDIDEYDQDIASFVEATKKGVPACTLDKFPMLVEELCQLPYNGKVIKNLVQGVTNATTKHNPAEFASQKTTIEEIPSNKTNLLMSILGVLKDWAIQK